MCFLFFSVITIFELKIVDRHDNWNDKAEQGKDAYKAKEQQEGELLFVLAVCSCVA